MATGQQRISFVSTILTQLFLAAMTAMGAVAWRTMDRIESQFGSKLDAVVKVSQVNSTRLERIEERIGAQGLYTQMFTNIRNDLNKLEVRVGELEKRR